MKIVWIILVLATLTACSRDSRSGEAAARHYPLSGKIVALDRNHQTATIDGAAIPNYMEAMTMEYPIKSKSDFQSLKVGEQIKATLDVVGDNSYTVSDIKPVPAVK